MAGGGWTDSGSLSVTTAAAFLAAATATSLLILGRKHKVSPHFIIHLSMSLFCYCKDEMRRSLITSAEASTLLRRECITLSVNTYASSFTFVKPCQSHHHYSIPWSHYRNLQASYKRRNLLSTSLANINQSRNQYSHLNSTSKICKSSLDRHTLPTLP